MQGGVVMAYCGECLAQMVTDLWLQDLLGLG